MNLTEEQQAIVANQKKSFKVMAAAGSGKTTTMTLYIKQACSGGDISPEQIIFITFTRLAALEISRKIRQFIGSCSNIRCGTFHKLMFLFSRAVGLPTPPHTGLYDLGMDRFVEEFLNHMRNRQPALVAYLRNFRILVVDEFQDLDSHQFEFIQLFKGIHPELYIIGIGDTAQNIYRFRKTSDEFLRTRLKKEVVPELEEHQLSINFRSNETILTTVNTVFAEEIQDGLVLPMTAGRTDIPGVRPRYYEFGRNPSDGYGDYDQRVANVIVQIIQRARVSGKSVVLIFPIIRCNSYEFITGYLRKLLGPEIDFHKIAKEDCSSATVCIEYDPRDPDAPVQLATFHASKGLEWDIVCLINVSDSVYEPRTGEIVDEGFCAERRNLLYVGMTRAIEELHIFADANRGGRHRLLARLGDRLGDVFDIEQWGEDRPSQGGAALRPIGVCDLIRRLGQHRDLLERIKTCSAHIPSTFHAGHTLPLPTAYTKMKERNRELAFGTFVDWMMKRALSDTPTLQCRILEILFNMNSANWFHKELGAGTLEVLRGRLEQFWVMADAIPNAELESYLTAVRCIANFSSQCWAMVPAMSTMFRETAAAVMRVFKKQEHTIRDKYILAQTFNLYGKLQRTEIEAARSPDDSWSGLPSEFELFAEVAIAPACATLKTAFGVERTYRIDIPVETESLIYGEMDLVSDDGGIIDIKCGSATNQGDLRGTSMYANLLQILTYVAMSRHGQLRHEASWAALINPLTGAWERYDLTAWSQEDSREFLNCLEELRRRC
jgi:hypothetical protein